MAEPREQDDADWKARLAELRDMLPTSARDDAKAPPYHHADTVELPMLEETDQRPTGDGNDISAGLHRRSGQAQQPTVGMPPASASARFFQRIDKSDEDLATEEGRLEELHAYHRAHYSWRIYRTLCQFRFGYFAFLVLMVIIMFSFTLLMEFFFAIFLPSAKYDEYYIPRSIVLLVTLPIALFFLSYFFEEASRLFFDAIDKTDGSLPNFRLALAVVIHYLRHRKEMQDAPEVAPHGGDSGENGGRRPTLLLTAKDDPFEDVGKHEEDIAWERREEMEEHAEAEAATAPLTAPHPSANTVNRWKRVKAAVTATLLIRKVEYNGPAIDVSTFVFVDLFCPVLFEVVTAVALVTEFIVSWSPSKAFLAYVQMGFWSLSVYLCVWIVTHFWSSRNRKMRMLVSNYRRRRRTLRRAVNELERHKRAEHLWLLDVGFRFHYHIGQKVNPATWWKARTSRKKPAKSLERSMQTDGTVQTDDVSISVRESDYNQQQQQQSGGIAGAVNKLQPLIDARARLHSRNPWHKLSLNMKAIILLVLVIGSALISLYSFMVGWPIMGIFLIALGTVIQKRFPQIFGRAFRHFITAFVLLSFIFFSSTIIIGTFASGGNFKLGPFMNGTETAVSTLTTSASVKTGGLTYGFQKTAEYPACTIDYDGLTVLDFALIADAAYGESTAVQTTNLENRLNGTELDKWTYVARNNESSDHQVWMELYFEDINMTVISVRGTASAADALEDLHFWFGILLMQAVDIFVPFLKQLPKAFVVKLLSMDLITSVMPSPVYAPLLKHVAEVRERVGDNLVITGHSLGGAMAAMVGAKTHTRAVSFSGPGLLYSRGRFDVTASDIRDNVLTFKPQKDIVPRVDELGGMVQELRCKRTNPMGCHSSLTHICELYLSCGDTRRRNWASNTQCLEYQALPETDDDDS
ncbi:hypothetical protein Gpo141_00002051 [Globisporangium polare]